MYVATAPPGTGEQPIHTKVFASPDCGAVVALSRVAQVNRHKAFSRVLTMSSQTARPRMGKERCRFCWPVPYCRRAAEGSRQVSADPMSRTLPSARFRAVSSPETRRWYAMTFPAVTFAMLAAPATRLPRSGRHGANLLDRTEVASPCHNAHPDGGPWPGTRGDGVEGGRDRGGHDTSPGVGPVTMASNNSIAPDRFCENGNCPVRI